MPAQAIQLLTLLSNLIVFLFLIYYILRIRAKEKELEKREMKIDSNYHHVVDEALAKEQKILQDASLEAQQILKGAQDLNQSTKQALDQALQTMSQNMRTETSDASKYFMTQYQTVLHQIANTSLSDFQTTTKGLNTELQKQIAELRTSMMPRIEKELEEYRAARIKESEQLVGRIIQKASQDIFNKTISLEDHHKLMVDALEKARKEGVFE